MGRVIKLCRRCCIECGYIWFGELNCPECEGAGEPIDAVNHVRLE